MDEQWLIRIEDKIDNMSSRMGRIETLFGEQTRRVEILESEFEPIKIKNHQFNGILKLFGGAGVLIGLVSGIYELFKH